MQLPVVSSPRRSVTTPYRVVLVLAPDFLAPTPHQRHRFPPMGPAVVAAVLRDDGAEVALADLALDVFQRPLSVPHDAVLDRRRLHAYLRGAADEALEALEEALLARLPDTDADVFAFSIERHTQINVGLLLALALKHRTGKPVVMGGGNFGGDWQSQGLGDLAGLDVVTVASSPAEIRTVFQAARALPHGRREPPVDPLPSLQAVPLDEWPLPDFSVFDLDRYRRDPFGTDGDAFPGYDGSLGPHLFLPYAMSIECQYACAFCQRGGTQNVQSMDKTVRDLAALAERYDTRDFLFFNTQFNLHAEALSQALIAAKLDLRWGDSFRVAPRRPRNVLETMAKAGCSQLTFGVESASDRMLKKMVKGHTAQMATSTLQDAHALGIYTRVNLLPCFPGETREDFEQTARWVTDNAYAIDDVSPSAFYLTLDSPIGQNPGRWGVKLRETRDGLEGDHRFRKAHAPVAYDEVDGFSWEEREATLRASEHELRQAWRDGRSKLGFAATRPAQAFALARRYPSKAEAYAKVAEWVHRQPGRSVDVAGVAALLARPGSTPAASPMDAFRQAAHEALRRALPAALEVSPPPLEGNRITLTVTAPGGVSCRFVVERSRPDLKAFRTEGELSFWYSTQGAEPRWLSPVREAAARALLSPALVKQANAFGETTSSAPAAQASFPHWSVVDLVRQRLKPAATLLEAQQADPFAGLDDLPAKALSQFYFVRNAEGSLSAAATMQGTAGRRMVYVGQDRESVERLRDLEHRLYTRELDEKAFVELQVEFGGLLGFPACCVRPYAYDSRRSRPYADYYASLVRLEAHLRPMDWRVNHVLAFFYNFPFFIHVPCSLDCEPTRALVGRVVDAAYPGSSGEVVRRALSSCAVVFPDDRIVPFQIVGAPDDGELVVTEFNVDAAPEALRRPRPPGLELPVDSQRGFRDAEVELLRVAGDALEVFARGRWHTLELPGQPAGFPPIVVIASSR